MNDDNEYGPWIEYREGDQRPADDVLVQVKLRSGGESCTAEPAKYWSWSWPGYGASGDIVAYRVKKSLVDTFRDAAGITGHPHAALMAEYAKDAAVNPEPWTLWQYAIGLKWCSLGETPRWIKDCQYRRKPTEIPTEVVNGFTVPKGLTEAPANGTLYYAANPANVGWYTHLKWDNDPLDRNVLARGLAFLTEEHAVAKSKAMCGVDPQWSQP